MKLLHLLKIPHLRALSVLLKLLDNPTVDELNKTEKDTLVLKNFNLSVKNNETIEELYVYGNPKNNYSKALKVNVRLINKETGEIKEDKIFMGEFPFMTPWGTFIINGSERVIVTQIIRSAGVFFSKEKNKKTGRVNYSGQIIPTRGAWIEFELGTKDIFYAKLDRSKKVPLSTFIRALGVKGNKDIIELFGESEFMRNTFEKDITFAEDDAIKELYEASISFKDSYSFLFTAFTYADSYFAMFKITFFPCFPQFL